MSVVLCVNCHLFTLTLPQTRAAPLVCVALELFTANRGEGRRANRRSLASAAQATHHIRRLP